jgi:hypothetical protein
MARKKKNEDGTAEPAVVSPAKAVKEAVPEEASGPVLKAPAQKRGKPAPQNKSRLPRKQKKSQKKLGGARAKQA